MNGQVFASWLFKQAVEIKTKSRHRRSVSQQPLGQAAAVVSLLVFIGMAVVVPMNTIGQ